MVAAVGLASIGCTMCPDPFDYSGPVPNGSPPQNDFRARSNGILPLGAAPRPWPPLVKDQATPAPIPGAVEQASAIAEEVTADTTGFDELTQTGAVFGDADEGVVTGDSESSAECPAADPPSDTSESVPTVAPETDPTAASLPTFQSDETPGWRTRRR